MKPLFIVIEGPDGSGKTTQAKLVAQAIGAAYESEPTDSPPGKLVRAVLRGQERVEDVRARQHPAEHQHDLHADRHQSHLQQRHGQHQRPAARAAPASARHHHRRRVGIRQ